MSPPAPPAPPEHDTLPPGTRFGEFEILRVIGIGGFGIVYLARDHSLERNVALKEYMPASLAARGAGPLITIRSAAFAETYAIGLRSFVNEARLLARFDHPSLVKVYRFWEDNQTAYMVMPFLQGITLRDSRRTMAHSPDETWIRRVVDPIMSALEQLHREGVFHRDIAPDNILLPPEGPPVLLDFGAARRVISDRTQSLTAILKPSYAPIEQYAEMSQLRQGPWTDIYALGAVMHYLLFGQPPAPATARALQDQPDPIAERSVPGVSPRFIEAVAWALAVRPTLRPQSIDELRGALDGRVPIPALGHQAMTVPGQLAMPVSPPPAPAQTYQPTMRVEPPRQTAAFQPPPWPDSAAPAQTRWPPPTTAPPAVARAGTPPTSAHPPTSASPTAVPRGAVPPTVTPPATMAPRTAAAARPPGATAAPVARTEAPRPMPTSVPAPAAARTAVPPAPPTGPAALTSAPSTLGPRPVHEFDPRSAAAAALRTHLPRPPPPRAPAPAPPKRGGALIAVGGVVIVLAAVGAWFATGHREEHAPAAAASAVSRGAAGGTGSTTPSASPTGAVAPATPAASAPGVQTTSQTGSPAATEPATSALPPAATAPGSVASANPATAANPPVAAGSGAARVAGMPASGASGARARAASAPRTDSRLASERTPEPTPPTYPAAPEPRRPVAATTPAQAGGPASAREACGGRVFLALAVCMERECDTPRFQDTVECVPVLQKKRAREGR
jgi:serine/threonine protein kinase